MCLWHRLFKLTYKYLIQGWLTHAMFCVTDFFWKRLFLRYASEHQDIWIYTPPPPPPNYRHWNIHIAISSASISLQWNFPIWRILKFLSISLLEARFHCYFLVNFNSLHFSLQVPKFPFARKFPCKWKHWKLVFRVWRHYKKGLIK
jgi:hypothetical protein